MSDGEAYLGWHIEYSDVVSELERRPEYDDESCKHQVDVETLNHVTPVN